MPKFHKHDIAKLQLQTAVLLFLNDRDRSSVITLAGAASGVLDTLVKKAEKEPFVDLARRIHCKLIGYTPKRESYSHHISKRLGIIAHKHLAIDDSETIEMDLEDLAIDALTRAMSDYVSLNGQEEPFVKAFFNWVWINKDGPGMMEKYKAFFKRLNLK